MEFKFAHIIVFFLLATSFETLMAQKESDELQVIKLPTEFKSNIECPGKQSWPESLGISLAQAKEVALKENPYIRKVLVILNGSPGPSDFSCFRVIMFVNIVDEIVQIPVVG